MPKPPNSRDAPPGSSTLRTYETSKFISGQGIPLKIQYFICRKAVEFDVILPSLKVATQFMDNL